MDLLRDLLRDLRHGARSLRRSPGFTATVVLSLALGIGANAAIFNVLNAVLLRPLPVRDPGGLVRLSAGIASGVSGEPERVIDMYSYPLFRRLGERARPAFQALAAQQAALKGVLVRWKEDEPPSEAATARAVSAGWFDVVGVAAHRGRTFLPEDETTPGANAVVVLSHDYWRRRFGANPALVGARLTINATAYTVVGVAAPGFMGATLGDRTDLWVPLTMHAALIRDEAVFEKRGLYWLHLLGRLAPGVSAAQAEASANVTLRQFLTEDPGWLLAHGDPDPSVPREPADVSLRVLPGAMGLDGARQSLREPLLVLMTGVGLLLVIVCLNVAHLMLARALGRRREMSIRTALGASRGRLLRQLLTEGLLLSALGGAGGALAMGWLTDALLALAPGAPVLPVGADGRVAAFIATLTLATALLVGLVPAVQASRGDLQGALRATGQSVAGAGSRRLLSRALLVSQVAFSLVLLVGAGLLAGSLGRLRAVDEGLDRDHLVVARLMTRELALGKERTLTLYDDLVRRVSALPGVRSASMSASGGRLLGTGSWYRPIRPAGATTGWTTVQMSVATPGHFETMGIALRRGRDFTRQDHGSAPKVAVVNETLARALAGGDQVLGRRFRIVPEGTADIEVVGVVSDARTRGLRESAPPSMFFPIAQSTEFFLNSLEVRVMGDPARAIDEVRRAIAEVSPLLPVPGVRTLRDQIDRSLMRERLLATLSTAFGLSALFLICVGLYGVIAQWAAQRTQEIGVRMALGATAGGVRWLVLRQSFALALAGVVVGIPATLATSRLFRGLLFGVEATDPATLAGAALVLLAVAGVAAYLPARRASRIDPMAALRSE